MATPMEHYRAAEAHLDLARTWSNSGNVQHDALMALIARANAHAVLATVSDSQYRPPTRSN